MKQATDVSTEVASASSKEPRVDFHASDHVLADARTGAATIANAEEASSR